jgi:hypothetical protein
MIDFVFHLLYFFTFLLFYLFILHLRRWVANGGHHHGL